MAGDWTTWVAAIGGGVGGLGGIAAAVVAGVAIPAARRSAAAAEASAKEARRAARIEVDRHHDALSPAGAVRVGYRLGRASAATGGGADALMATIELPRTEVPRAYRVRGVAVSGNSTTTLGLPLLLQPGRPVVVHVEHWPPGKTTPVTRELHLRFWPPAPIDETQLWSCDCGRPTDDNAQDGHWDVRVPVDVAPGRILV